MIKNYRKKSTVKAIQFTNDNVNEILKILNENNVSYNYNVSYKYNYGFIEIQTKNGGSNLYLNDWLIISDEIYPCSKSYFDVNYMGV